MCSHTWVVTDYEADTLTMQFYFATSVEGIFYKEPIYNWGKSISKSVTGEALFN